MRAFQRSRAKCPIATVSAYGPDNRRATTLVVGILRRAGQKSPNPMCSWSTDGTDVRNDRVVAAELADWLGNQGIKDTLSYDRIIGCPHEEGKSPSVYRGRAPRKSIDAAMMLHRSRASSERRRPTSPYSCPFATTRRRKSRPKAHRRKLGMSRRLLKFGGGRVAQFLTSLCFQERSGDRRGHGARCRP
jgi:hypothetical protein